MIEPHIIAVQAKVNVEKSRRNNSKAMAGAVKVPWGAEPQK